MKTEDSEDRLSNPKMQASPSCILTTDTSLKALIYLLLALDADLSSLGKCLVSGVRPVRTGEAECVGAVCSGDSLLQDEEEWRSDHPGRRSSSQCSSHAGRFTSICSTAECKRATAGPEQKLHSTL
ncbi:unnamed protein product [Leuciscus chuanchicus]